ncbi:MAG: DUF4249 domain-containing protein [Chryseolinea sp.]
MRIVLTGVAVICISCVDPINTKVVETSDHFVVDGRITDGEGPYKITLSSTSNYSANIDGFTKYVSEAKVKVCNENGGCIPFYEITKGHYETTADVSLATVGHSYHVDILTKEGQRILSKPEILKASPPITKVYYEYDINTVTTEGFKVYLDTDDPANDRNYYKWETLSYFPYSSQCFYEIPGDLKLLLASDKFTNGNAISRIPLQRAYFNRKDYFLVVAYQFSLSENAYAYLENVDKQVTTTGSIFDAPPTLLRGNLYVPDNDDAIVLGYFAVCGVQEKSVLIDRNLHGVSPFPRSKPLSDAPCYCGVPCKSDCDFPCNETCPDSPFNPCLCGAAPCPPACHYLKGVTSVAPKDWPLPHHPCN